VSIQPLVAVSVAVSCGGRKFTCSFIKNLKRVVSYAVLCFYVYNLKLREFPDVI